MEKIVLIEVIIIERIVKKQMLLYSAKRSRKVESWEVGDTFRSSPNTTIHGGPAYIYIYDSSDSNSAQHDYMPRTKALGN